MYLHKNNKMMNFSLILILFAVVNPSISKDDSIKENLNSSQSQDWDYLVYSQRWLITGCEEYREESPKNQCNMPTNPQIWGVHGVWPTKTGTEGPFNCDTAIHFDPDQLAPLMDKLKQFWPNIESNTKPDSFWKHEWSKHGTCAASLPQLNSVTNYFRQGLEWNKEFDIADILSKNKIVPNDQGYDIQDIYNTIKNEIGKNPMVSCVVDGKSKQSLIDEVRICFNKSLDLIDCDVAKSVFSGLSVGDILTNCSLKKRIMYLGTVPTPPSPTTTEEKFDDYDEEYIQKCLENYKFRDLLLKIYGVVKFLIWFTL